MPSDPSCASRSSPSLFVSYSRADWHRVELIVAEVRRRGISTWVDIEDILPGAHWKEAVDGAIQASSAIMFCISPLCLESGRTLTELRKAIAQGNLVIPVMVEWVDFDELPRELSERQVIEVWREPPATGAIRAARKIARQLCPDELIDEKEADREQIANLILTLGDGDAAPVHSWLRDHAATPADSIAEKGANVIGDLALVERWIESATAVHVVLGENVSPETCAFFLGHVHARAGSASMCVFSARPNPVAESIGSALRLRLRRFDELNSVVTGAADPILSGEGRSGA